MTLLSPKTTLRDDRCLTWGGLLFPLIDFACALPVCAPAQGGREPPRPQPAILRQTGQRFRILVSAVSRAWDPILPQIFCELDSRLTEIGLFGLRINQDDPHPQKKESQIEAVGMCGKTAFFSTLPIVLDSSSPP
ncbi:hypothetical protein AVEN_93700-1 [Araneus ventricosus]|uniref:Uncharacterized protein n=1 Tax=Araneus ventricosus TaxID=182803 RepID=A0A4Y2JEW5_ARAVE|nr:hypothetical protein AVEN_93700-1 [Araneus ventricosus]